MLMAMITSQIIYTIRKKFSDNLHLIDTEAVHHIRLSALQGLINIVRILLKFVRSTKISCFLYYIYISNLHRADVFIVLHTIPVLNILLTLIQSALRESRAQLKPPSMQVNWKMLILYICSILLHGYYFYRKAKFGSMKLSLAFLSKILKYFKLEKGASYLDTNENCFLIYSC